MNHTISYSTVGVNKSFEFLNRKKKVNKDVSWMRNARENCSSIKSPKIEIELKLKNSIDCFIIKNVKYIEKKDKKKWKNPSFQPATVLSNRCSRLYMYKVDWRKHGRVLTSPSALFFSSSFCLACSSAMRASIAARDSRVNGRNKLLSSSDTESESSDIV